MDHRHVVRVDQILRVGQNHIYTVCIRYFWQGFHHIYGHIRCIYTVLANPTHAQYKVYKIYKVYKKGLQSRSATASTCAIHTHTVKVDV